MGFFNLKSLFQKKYNWSPSSFIKFGLFSLLSITLSTKIVVNCNRLDDDITDNSRIDSLEVEQTTQENIITNPSPNIKKTKVIPKPKKSSQDKIIEVKENIILINTHLKDKTKKNIAFLINTKNRLDTDLINDLNFNLSQKGFNSVDLFNNESLSVFKSFNNPSEEFINNLNLSVYIDAYFVCNLNQTNIPNTFETSRFSSQIKIKHALLVLIHNNSTIISKPYDGPDIIRGNGITQELANENTQEKLNSIFVKFIDENYTN